MRTSSEFYTAGVVEFAAANASLPPKDQLEYNLKQHIEIIDSADAKSVDVLVFPEFALNSFNTPAIIPREADRVSPCGLREYSVVVQRISCAAKRARKYVVINLTSQQNCSAKTDPQCNASGLVLYNTAVAFDRYGIVIST